MYPRHQSRHSHLTRAATSAALAFTIVLASCGSDDAAPATSPVATVPPTEAAATTLPATTQPPTTDATSTELTLPSKRSDIVATPGDLPNGVYRFTQDIATLQASDPGGSYSAADEFIGEWILKDGTSEIHYFNMDSTPMGDPPDTGGIYQVQGDVVIWATPPSRSMPGTNGILLLRWSFDGDTLTFEQIDGRRLDADFMAPWVRVGDAP